MASRSSSPDTGGLEPGEERSVESGSGSEMEGAELEREFEYAAERVRELVQTASREELLYLYARYKQVSGQFRSLGVGSGPDLFSMEKHSPVPGWDSDILLDQSLVSNAFSPAH
ncbi:Acyl-CoA-binding domain-containing protein 6 [Bagarius yarrelli]|uniref:Acyl-CoA-binding domain-containing protein 6 n=1 Tax=Bagarius yarrelli TaxID=175774 RepID=A0A556VV54_BAGYA|nr:Acyl-CoA-binding domain-containing protein 6 [Bagarius yarrelli]